MSTRHQVKPKSHNRSLNATSATPSKQKVCAETFNNDSFSALAEYYTLKTTERFAFFQWALLWGLLVCVLVAAIPLGSNRPVSWTLLSMAITGLFCAQILLDSVNRMPTQAKGLWLPVFLFLGAVGWGFVQTLPGLPDAYMHPVWSYLTGAAGRISADPGQGHQVVMRYLCYAMIFWIAFKSSLLSTRAGTILKSFAIFSTVLAVYGLYTLAVGNNPVLGEGEQANVISATFVNRNSYATYAAFGALANIAAYLHIVSGTRSDDDRWQNLLRDMLEQFFDGAWIYALGALLCIGALTLTQSRAGGIAGMVGLLVFLSTWRGRERRWNPWLWAVMLAVIGFVILTSATGMTNRILATGPENARFLIYPEVVKAIMDRPLLGHGLGSFHDVFRQYVPAEAAVGEWVRAHNSYLENAFEFGLPGAAAFYLALLIFANRIRRATVVRKNNRAFPCFALACIATAATHSLFDFSLQMPAIAAIFAVILALGWGQSFSNRTRHEKRAPAKSTEPVPSNPEPTPELSA
ncbi:MAG: O-antigen ligase family protein [Rhodothermales bacterium]